MDANLAMVVFGVLYLVLVLWAVFGKTLSDIREQLKRIADGLENQKSTSHEELEQGGAKNA